jgi:tetratricopeptide (TPR) repeat protein
MTDSTNERSPQSSNLNVSISAPIAAAEIIKAREVLSAGRLQEAESTLEAFLNKDPLPSIADQLISYAIMIRIAAELRHLDKIQGYISVIKSMKLESALDRRCFADCLYMTGIGWLHSGSNDKARQFFKQSLEVAVEMKDEKLIFKNQLALVEIMRIEGQYQEVLAQADSLTVAAEASNDKSNLGNVYLLLGNVYRKQGNYSSAIQAYEKAREVFSSNKNSGDYHYSLWALGTSYAAMEDKEKAKIYLELACHSDSSAGMEFWRINVLSNLTLAELKTIVGEYSAAEKLYEKVIRMAGEDENSYYGRRALRGKTLLSIKTGQFDVANELIDRLVIVAVREKNQGEIMRLRLLKAEVLLRNGEAAQHDEARAMLEEALAYFRERGVRRHQAVCLELLARLDSRSGNPNDASKKVSEMLELANQSTFERLSVRAALASLVLERKLGRNPNAELMAQAATIINRLNMPAERVILERFKTASYDEWTKELSRIDPHFQRYANEFFEDFHFVSVQAIDMEIDSNSHYVREKHLGEIPFHNKFTLMRILLLLAETPGKEFSKEQLAQEIWGQEYNPLRHDNNIYININRLRKLIEPNPRESRYCMNGARGYYFNPAMKVNISSKISDVAPRIQNNTNKLPPARGPGEGVRP